MKCVHNISMQVRCAKCEAQFAPSGNPVNSAHLLAQLKADAERYRYLRNTPPWNSPVTVILSGDVGDDIAMITQDALDAVIDEAMKK